MTVVFETNLSTIKRNAENAVSKKGIKEVAFFVSIERREKRQLTQNRLSSYKQFRSDQTQRIEPRRSRHSENHQNDRLCCPMALERMSKLTEQPETENNGIEATPQLNS